MPDEFGWFAYAPLNESVLCGFPWEYVVVLVVLLTLNALLLHAAEDGRPGL